MELNSLLNAYNNDNEPFKLLVLSKEWENLNSLTCRSECPKCKRSRMYFCYNCIEPVSDVGSYIPKIKLPCKLDIIKHSREIDSKSTAIHAALIAPQDVTIYTYPDIPDYKYEDKVVLVFPSKNAVSVEDGVYDLIRNDNKCKDEAPIKKVVFIDSTWFQCNGIFKDPRLAGLPCVVLKTRMSQFWRHQNRPRWHLATIEAIHQFFVELYFVLQKLRSSRISNTQDTSENEISQRPKILYHGEYDDLLFFFRFMHFRIHNMYNTLLPEKKPRFMRVS